MKFSEMPYERPDMSALKEQFAALTERLQNAPDYAAARAAFLEEQVLNKHVDTLFTLASVRHTIDTRDKFYDEEMEFANSAMPQIQLDRRHAGKPLPQKLCRRIRRPDVCERRN